MEIDEFDRKILALLQADASLTTAELSSQVNLSGSQCSRRKAALENAGYIDGYSARLNARRLGFAFKAIARINLKSHGEASAEDFVRFLDRHSVVRAAYSVSGDADYVLEIVTRDLAEYAEFIHRDLLPFAHVGQVRSDIVLMTLKEDAGLPIGRG
jgi:DNA-binding Lrp family transcriptional regulator